MIKRLLFMQCLVTVFLLQACVSAKIESNKQADYNKQPKKIFILIGATKDTKSFCSLLTTSLANKLKQRGIENTVYVKSSLSLDTDSEINDKINAYDPEALLFFKQTYKHTTNNAFDGAKFDISLIDKDKQNEVWKSKIDIFGSMSINNATEKAVNTILEKLTADKII